MTTYKDSKVVQFTHNKRFEDDKVRESTITLNSHTGTHIDAPSHFLQNGTTLEHIPLEHLVGPCRVLDLTHVKGSISDRELEKHDIQAGQRLLLKTTNSVLEPTSLFDYNFVYLDASGAQFLASKKVLTVGIDYLGIERNQPDHETHATLFEHNIVIIEGLRLKDVQPGCYELYCLPLAVHGLEAAPARAVLQSN